MAQLLVRKIDDRVVRALRARAARHNQSVEAEHRAILEQTLLGGPAVDFKTFLASMPDGGGDDLFARAPDLPRDVEL